MYRSNARTPAEACREIVLALQAREAHLRERAKEEHRALDKQILLANANTIQFETLKLEEWAFPLGVAEPSAVALALAAERTTHQALLWALEGFLDNLTPQNLEKLLAALEDTRRRLLIEV